MSDGTIIGEIYEILHGRSGGMLGMSRYSAASPDECAISLYICRL